MEFVDEKKNQIAVVRLIGRIDSVSAKQFEEKIVSVLDAGETSLLVDFSQCDFINSTGLRVLLLAAKKVQPKHGSIAICGLTEYLHELFRIAGISNLFIVRSTEDEAIQSMIA